MPRVREVVGDRRERERPERRKPEPEKPKYRNAEAGAIKEKLHAMKDTKNPEGRALRRELRAKRDARREARANAPQKGPGIQAKPTEINPRGGGVQKAKPRQKMSRIRKVLS